MGFWDYRKVLVTGGVGFVGSHLVEQLLEVGRDIKVTVADNFRNGRQNNLAGVLGRIRVESADLTDPAHCKRIFQDQQVVLHLAARVGGVGFNVAHPATMFRDNIRLSSYVLEAAQSAQVERILIVSSACVYPRHCIIPTPESEGFVGWPEDTNEGYGWAKRMAEFEARAYRKEFGIKAAIARPYNCYGPRDYFDPEISHVIPALIRRFLDGENPVRVWGDGSQTRAFLYVEDLARGLLQVTEHYAECDPINLGTDEEITIKDLVELIRELCGSQAEILFDPSRPSGQPRRNCDTVKAKALINFEPRISLREGLKRTIAWYRERHSTESF